MIISANGCSNCEKNVSVSVSDNAARTTKFTISTTNNTTGSATFANGSTEIIINGNVTNQPLKIEGVTESSQADNIIIEARFNNSSTVSAQDNFTVAVIKTMDFSRINRDDVPLDPNPGPDGTPTPDGSEGKRIYPDKIDVADVSSGKDRSLVKVTAYVSPTLPNVKVYFGSYDLDDPSSNIAPIDANGSDGDDNNGTVNGSKAGDFTVPAGFNCSTATGMPTPARIGCDIASNGTATAVFKTTMQPGDNFAIAASLDGDYRTSLVVNPMDGANLINSANQIIPISREANPDNVQGLRTEMLTVWRKLHIEADSMENVTGNSVTGTITQIYQTVCPTPPGNCTISTVYAISNTQLEENRFENGLIEIGPRRFRVAQNGFNQTANSEVVLLDGNPQGANVIRSGSQFTLYDDDDFNDDDTARLNGDDGEIIPVPPDSLVKNTDLPCSTTLTSNCNTFAPAYVKPIYDLPNAHQKTPFVTNVNVSVNNPSTTNPSAAEIQAHFNFDNVGYEAQPGFWTVYLNGAYQYDERADHDPNSQSGILGIVDALNSQGALIFFETTRPAEITNPIGRPVSRDYTVAHEIGHLFFGRHDDYFPVGATNPASAGLMATTTDRTSGTFNDVTLNKIRGGEFIVNGVTTRITHP